MQFSARKRWWIKRKVAKCSIKIFNYTARARAYTIIAKWPEDKSTRMTHNERGGRKEARGLWAWRLDAINPGDMAMIGFSVSGLNKGDWVEIFYRGNGEIIGAEKIDETLLEEARKQERLQVVGRIRRN